MNTKEKDAELVSVIEEAMATSQSDAEALEKVIKFQKGHRGLVGLHIGAPLDVLCGQRTVEDPEKESENIAHAVLMIMLASAKGQLEEVDVSKADL